MKITLIGAAGVRTPLLVHGLAKAGQSVKVDELAFWDTDAERLSIMGRVSEAVAKQRGLRARLKSFSEPESALADADYVITSIRVGGINARVKDETIALAHGLVGQETVGAGGFACAMRNLAAMLDYAKVIQRVAPRATVINFTNPVGIISQGLLNHSQINPLGVCDTPLETFEAIAHALSLNPFDLHFDYLGLNHLGWVRSIRDSSGNELMPKVLASPELIQKCYRHGLFPPKARNHRSTEAWLRLSRQGCPRAPESSSVARRRPGKALPEQRWKKASRISGRRELLASSPLILHAMREKH